MAGGSQPHSNLMPSVCVSYIIALVGIYPSQN
jgi:microcystin-dependent protein